MHFNHPFEWHETKKHAIEVEQDTLEDVVNCVAVAILTELGYRPEVPTYGIPDPVFELQPVSLADLIAAVEALEPRAAILMDQIPDSTDPLIDRVTAVVSLRSAVEA